METVYIYGLWDPRTYELRYIGKTVDIKNRLKAHINDTKKKAGFNEHREAWIRQLISEGLEPAIEVLEECHENNWKEVERAWIKEGKEKDLDLTNLSDGGDGFSSGKNHPQYGRKMSDEEKRKLSESLKGKKTGYVMPEDTKKKLREANLGKKHSSETILKMALAQQGEKNHFRGKKHSEETRARMKKPHRKMSAEQRKKLSEIRKGKMSEERKKQISQINKGKTFPDSTRKKMSLSNSMSAFYRRGDLDKVHELQKQHFELFGTYNSKYPKDGS